MLSPLGNETLGGDPVDTQDCDGTAVGVATCSGSLGATRGLSAASIGVATCSGSLSMTRGLSAASTGVATVSGSLETSLLAVSAGVATCSGSLGTPVGLSSTVAGVATAAPTLAVTRGLASAANGQATVQGSTVNLKRPLTVTVAGHGACGGSLLALQLCSGSSDGSASGDATVTVSHGLDGRADGFGSVGADLALRRGMRFLTRPPFISVGSAAGASRVDAPLLFA